MKNKYKQQANHWTILKLIFQFFLYLKKGNKKTLNIATKEDQFM